MAIKPDEIMKSHGKQMVKISNLNRFSMSALMVGFCSALLSDIFLQFNAYLSFNIDIKKLILFHNINKAVINPIKLR